jgi:hypothetical protein
MLAHSRFIASCFSGLAMAFAGQARATPITITFTGHVHDLDGLQDFSTTGILAPDLASLGVTVGAPVTGHIQYDSDTPNLSPSPTEGLYTLSSFDITIGKLGGTFIAPRLILSQPRFPPQQCPVTFSYDVYPNPGPINSNDDYIPSPPPLNSTIYSTFTMAFQLFSGTQIASSDLPLGAPGVAPWGVGQYSYIRFNSTVDGLAHDIPFVIDSMSPPAPTPLSPYVLLQRLVGSTLMANLAGNLDNQLDPKLQAALTTFAAASAQLQVFVDSVRNDVANGRISCDPTTGAPALVQAAQNIVAALGEPPLTVSLACP